MNKAASFLLIFLLLTNLTSVQASECTDQNYQLVWADEFNYSGILDRSKWNYEEGYIRNKELQYYEVESIENSYVRDGFLTIEAKYDPSKRHPYSSASITTEQRAAWRYGKIEVRASIPTAQGTWPAIWMLGDNFREVNWPRTGEIDIMEHIGRYPNRIHANAIFYDYDLREKQAKNGANITIKSAQQFNTYAIKWTNESITYLINDKPFHQFDTTRAGKENNPFNKPFYLILNLALGGWGGAPEKDFTSEKFVIDYVRVYQDSCDL